jgi:uncharacterized protein (TIGR02594 family)
MAMILQSVGRDGANVRSDVELVQTLVNKHIALLKPMRPLRVDGQVGPRTIAAIEEFQRRVIGMDQPDGLVDRHGRTIKSLSKSTLAASTRPKVALGARQADKPTPQWLSIAVGEAVWLPVAFAEDGQREKASLAKNNPRILEYLRTVPYLAQLETKEGSGIHLSDVDETAWCACFVNWCLINSGKGGYPSARAKDWLKYGRALDTPLPGAITVVYKTPRTSADRKTTASGYHVAFYVSGTNASLTLFGGNQRNQVNEKSFAGWEVRGYRWPL